MKMKHSCNFFLISNRNKAEKPDGSKRPKFIMVRRIISINKKENEKYQEPLIRQKIPLIKVFSHSTLFLLRDRAFCPNLLRAGVIINVHTQLYLAGWVAGWSRRLTTVLFISLICVRIFFIILCRLNAGGQVV